MTLENAIGGFNEMLRGLAGNVSLGSRQAAHTRVDFGRTLETTRLDTKDQDRKFGKLVLSAECFPN